MDDSPNSFHDETVETRLRATPEGDFLMSRRSWSVENVRTYSFVITWLLSFLLGVFAFDRFYLGKYVTGVLKLLTLGGAGLWWLVDLVLVLAGVTRDGDGQRLVGCRKYRIVAWVLTPLVTAGVILWFQ